MIQAVSCSLKELNEARQVLALNQLQLKNESKNDLKHLPSLFKLYNSDKDYLFVKGDDDKYELGSEEKDLISDSKAVLAKLPRIIGLLKNLSVLQKWLIEQDWSRRAYLNLESIVLLNLVKEALGRKELDLQPFRTLFEMFPMQNVLNSNGFIKEVKEAMKEQIYISTNTLHSKPPKKTYPYHLVLSFSKIKSPFQPSGKLIYSCDAEEPSIRLYKN